MLTFLSDHLFASFFGAIGVVLTGLGIAQTAHAIATRFKVWQFHVLGVAFVVIFVVMILTSYEESQISKMPTRSQNQTEKIADSSVLPMGVSDDYISLLSNDHTDLQEQRFLKAYVGKSLVLTAPMISFTQSRNSVVGQFYAGDQPNLFANFSPEWEDHLLDITVGEELHFQTKIVERDGRYRLEESYPL